MKKVIEFIEKHEKFAVLTHVNPDGDALGSAYALSQSINNLGKFAKVILLCNPPKKYQFDEFEGMYALYDNISADDYDAVIAVDAATVGRLSDAQKLFLALPNCNIDHHVSNTRYAQVNYVADFPATGEIVYSLAEKLGLKPDMTVRMAVYIAIATDTGNFTFSNTKRSTLKLFSALVEGELPLADIADQIFNRRTLGATKLIAKFIENIRLHENGQIALSTIMLDELTASGANVSDSDILIDYAREIDGVEIAIFVREMSRDTYKASFRANSYADVGNLAARFDGGGHVKAAGCMIKGNIYDVMEILLKAAKDYLK
ncbi:MAG: bifunctional oligoribonuclease/PAP phosphatase NrnA [Christensenella sp.]